MTRPQGRLTGCAIRQRPPPRHPHPAFLRTNHSSRIRAIAAPCERRSSLAYSPICWAQSMLSRRPENFTVDRLHFRYLPPRHLLHGAGLRSGGLTLAGSRLLTGGLHGGVGVSRQRNVTVGTLLVLVGRARGCGVTLEPAGAVERFSGPLTRCNCLMRQRVVRHRPRAFTRPRVAGDGTDESPERVPQAISGNLFNNPGPQVHRDVRGGRGRGLEMLALIHATSDP